VDPAVTDQVRAVLPSLANRRDDVFAPGGTAKVSSEPRPAPQDI
jgi:hypothetical protein